MLQVNVDVHQPHRAAYASGCSGHRRREGRERANPDQHTSEKRTWGILGGGSISPLHCPSLDILRHGSSRWEGGVPYLSLDPRNTNLTGSRGTLVDLVQTTHGLEEAGRLSLKSLVIHLRKPLSLGPAGYFHWEFIWMVGLALNREGF